MRKSASSLWLYNKYEAASKAATGSFTSLCFCMERTKNNVILSFRWHLNNSLPNRNAQRSVPAKLAPTVPPTRAHVIHLDCVTLPTTQVFYPRTRKGLWGRVEWGHRLCLLSWLANGRFVCACVCVIQCLHVARPDIRFDQSENVITLLSSMVLGCIYVCVCARAMANVSTNITRRKKIGTAWCGLSQTFSPAGKWGKSLSLGGCVTCSLIRTQVNLSLTVQRSSWLNFAQ